MNLTTKISFVLLTLFTYINVSGQDCDNDISAEFTDIFYCDMRYPLIDFANNIEGISTYLFDTDSIVGINGIRLVSSSGSTTLDSEAKRLISEIPTREFYRNKLSKNTTYKISINFKLEENKIYREDEVRGNSEMICDEPAFPGGTSVLLKQIQENLNFPPEANEMSIQGRVVCGVVIEKNGAIGAVEILSSLDKIFDAEVIRAIKRLPRFMPGKYNGRCARVYLIIPAVF